MYNEKMIIMTVLSAIVVVEVALDFDVLFSAVAKQPKETIYRSSGMVDKMFGKESSAKYSNVVTGNIFGAAETGGTVQRVTNNMVRSVGDFMLELRGVTITPDKRFALIWDKQERKSIVADVGEDVSKWKVLSIFHDRVVIGSSGVEKEMFVNKTAEANKP